MANDPMAPNEGERVTNFQAVMNMLPLIPGAEYVTQPGQPSVGLFGLHDWAGSSLNTLLSGVNLGITVGSLFPQAQATLSQVHLVAFLMFALADPSSFEEYNGNIYVQK